MTRLICPLLLLLLLATGCVSKIRDTGYLPQYESFANANERSMKISLNEDAFGFPAAVISDEEPPVYIRVAANDSVTSRPIALVISEPEWLARDAFEDLQRQEDIIFTLRERLYRYFLRRYPHPVRVRYAFARNDPVLRDYHVVTITTAITDFKKGDGWSRYLLGYGAGKAYIQIEGEIFDGNSREHKIGEFAIRRGHGGYGQNGLNPSVLKDDYVMLYAVEQAVDHLTRRFSTIIPGLEEYETAKPEPGIVVAAE